MARLLLRALPFAVGAMALNVATAFLWVWFYSTAVAPGHDEAFYQAYAMRAAPISSIVAGAPILFLAGWLAARGRRSSDMVLQGALVGVWYSAVDLALLASMPNAVSWGLVALSLTTKVVASFLGGAVSHRRLGKGSSNELARAR